tara:strand:+ start:1785 stop:1940 length:156 start_codon:yes stop_codon:yes gene_type:complete
MIYKSDSDRTRTYNLQLRRLLLYPVELRNQEKSKDKNNKPTDHTNVVVVWP